MKLSSGVSDQQSIGLSLGVYTCVLKQDISAINALLMC